MKWLLPNICFLAIDGSQAYSMNTKFSDFDCKGIVLPPGEIREHLFNKFDQAINNKELEEKYSHLKNPNNPKFESTLFGLSKFIQLAAQVNPNIISLLWTHPSDILECNKIGEELLNNRNLFLSTKAKFTFGGYSKSQFSLIERHRRWLVKGELTKPERKDYGLVGEVLQGHAEIDRLVKKEIENWNFSKFSLDELERQELKETVWECVLKLCNNKISWDNWPQKYEEAIISDFVNTFNLSAEVTNLILRETRYKNDLKDYNSWINWKANRNLDRMKLEKDYNFDTKSAAHLVRLSRMSTEILSGKGVIVKRPDADELLAIRNGAWTYDQLKDWFDKQTLDIEELYKTTTLPKSVNYEKINELYQRLLTL